MCSFTAPHFIYLSLRPFPSHLQAHRLPKKAEGETVPLLRDTMTLMPVSMKGTEKSTTSDRSSLMVSDPTAM